MPLTLGDAARRLVDEIKTIPIDEARRRVNRAYRDVSRMHGWQHNLKRFTLQTEAAYTTGTVAASGTTLTGTGTTWLTSWTTAPSMRRVAIQGRSEPYDITVVSATSATLADTWLGSSDSGLTYRMFRDTYPLPTDCGAAKLVAIYDPEQRVRLWNFNQAKFLDVRSENPALTGIPECFSVVNNTSETNPRPQIQMYPATSAVRAYHGWYFKRPAVLSADANVFDVPEDYEEMIPLHAMISYYETPLRLSQKMLSVLRPKFADMFRQMKTEMDGQSAIDFEIEQARTGASTGWSPNPLGLSGFAMVDWN
jgi:hypothetical protein